jgi:hypothetical protein
MEKLNRQTGLIRLDSEENIAHSKKHGNWRLKAYSTVMVLLLGFLAYLLVSRNDVDATVLRTPGQIFQTLPDGRLSNLYSLKLANKTRKDVPLTLKLENIKGEINIIGNNLTVPKESYYQTPFFVKINRGEIVRRKTPIVIGIYENGKKIKSTETTFLGPGY